MLSYAALNASAGKQVPKVVMGETLDFKLLARPVDFLPSVEMRCRKSKSDNCKKSDFS